MKCHKCDKESRHIEYQTFSYYYCDTCKVEVELKKVEQAYVDDSNKIIITPTDIVYHGPSNSVDFNHGISKDKLNKDDYSDNTSFD